MIFSEHFYTPNLHVLLPCYQLIYHWSSTYLDGLEAFLDIWEERFKNFIQQWWSKTNIEITLDKKILDACVGEWISLVCQIIYPCYEVTGPLKLLKDNRVIYDFEIALNDVKYSKSVFDFTFELISFWTPGLPDWVLCYHPRLFVVHPFFGPSVLWSIF